MISIYREVVLGCGVVSCFSINLKFHVEAMSVLYVITRRWCPFTGLSEQFTESLLI